MVKSSKTPQQLGKEFEEDIGSEFKKLMSITKTYFHRLYDSTSAGAFLPSQPGDFIVLYEGTPWLIEAKSSTKFDSLAGKRETLGLFDSAQIAKMRLWHRAGGKVGVLFKSHDTGTVELWHGLYIANCFNTPRLRVAGNCRVQLWLENPGYLRSVALCTLNNEMKDDGL